MLALARLAGMAVLGLTVIFVCLTLWFRWGERERLEAEWERERPPLPRYRHVEIGMAPYRERLRRRLIVGVYVVPILAICGLIYAFN